MAGIVSLLEKLGFINSPDDEANTRDRYESDAEDEDDEEEEEEEGGSGFSFPFSFSFFGRGERQEDDEEDADEEDESSDEEEEDESPVRGRAQPRSSRVIDYKKSKEKRYDAAADEVRSKHCEHIVVVRQLADSRTIITHLHNGDSVILNLENIDPKDCGRVIDLLSGAAFALGGNIIKVSRLTYLLAPDTVKVIPPQTVQASNRYSL